MTQLRPPVVHVDPFFDGEFGNLRRADPNAQPAASNLGYADPDSDRTENGQPLTSVMRASPARLRGVIIPKSNDGVPVGLELHEMANVVVHIDPDIPGQGGAVRLGTLTPELISAAADAAAAVTPPPSDISSRRFRSSATMRAIADAGDSQSPEPVRVSYAAPGPQGVVSTTSGPIPQHPHQPHAQQPQPVQRRVVPMNGGARVSPFTSVAPVQRGNGVTQAAQAPAAPPVVAAPTVHVFFEIQHFGEHDAYYHSAQVADGFAILIRDTRFQGPRYFPSPSNSDESPSMRMNIEGTTEIYQVTPTGIMFTYRDCEFCVLTCAHVGSLDQSGA